MPDPAVPSWRAARVPQPSTRPSPRPTIPRSVEQVAERPEQRRVAHRERVDLPDGVLSARLEQLVRVQTHHEPAHVEEEVVGPGHPHRQAVVLDDDGAVLDEQHPLNERRPRQFDHLASGQVRHRPGLPDLDLDPGQGPVGIEEPGDPGVPGELPRQGVAAGLALVRHRPRERQVLEGGRNGPGRQGGTEDQYPGGQRQTQPSSHDAPSFSRDRIAGSARIVPGCLPPVQLMGADEAGARGPDNLPGVTPSPSARIRLVSREAITLLLLTAVLQAPISPASGEETQADLAAQLAGPSGAVAVPNEAGITATVSNPGPTDASSVQLTLDLADGLEPMAVDQGPWTCTIDAAVTCVLATLLAGDVAAVDVTVAAVSSGSLPVSATVSQNSADPNAENDTMTILVAASGRPCDAVGTAGPDTLEAKGRGNVACGLRGDDVILGGDGRQILFGGSGRDALGGGRGHDRLGGGAGGDACA